MRINRIATLLKRLPPWTLSALTVILILWLTLAPQPLPDNDLPLFPGADKIVHALMFGWLAFAACLDFARRHRWQISRPRIWNYALLAALFGIGIEFLQRSMGMGRSFEIADIIADTLGTILAAIVVIFASKRINLSKSKEKVR